MIEVRTLLRESDGTFTLLSDASVPGASVPDSDYIEGAIELVINGVEICGQAQWDLVDQLWVYICTMLGDFRIRNRVSTRFPDMPVELIFERQKVGRMLVTCVGKVARRTSVAEDEFLRAMAKAARSALTGLAVLAPVNAMSYEEALSLLAS
ncbi:hypothetical protein ATK36_0334 [Amycolatopsis sulphurea]|uniref:Uncharacterized protein n=1 Tax=Amycolatopsis sulphurea TaxID=76022 RepID=A0A2A9G243_9PSEU|nr:hypothetical protein [Amycolatopsis sulphurea]PFG56805.1 hypothetical protein ATK36_0334 [Amycolatopsis sulphurea]